MLEVIIFLIMIVAIGGIFFMFGRITMNDKGDFLRKHILLLKILLFGYIIFVGCFIFPLRSAPFPFDYSKAYILIATYGTMGLGLAAIYGEKKEIFVYSVVLFLTILGMACRYTLEYGEVSNTYNFTIFNIVSYVVIVPLFTVIAYHYVVRYLKAKK